MCITVSGVYHSAGEYYSNPAGYLSVAGVANGNVTVTNHLSPVIVLLLYATLLLGIVYLIFAGNVMNLLNRFSYGRFTDPTIRVRTPVEIDFVMASHRQCDILIDEIRGDKPQPTSTFNSIATKQSYSVRSFDDGTSLNENTLGTSGCVTTSSNYSDLSYRSKIVGGGNGLPRLTRSMFQGTESVADKGCDVHRHTVKKPSQDPSMQDDYRDPKLRVTVPHHADFNLSTLKVQYPPVKQNIHQKDLDSDLEVSQQVQRAGESENQHSNNDSSKWQSINQPTKPSSPSSLPEPKKGYNKPSYAVLIGDSVKVYSTNIFAALPSNNKFLVKERHQDLSGVTRVKLTLKSTEKDRYIISATVVATAMQKKSDLLESAFIGHIHGIFAELCMLISY